MGRVSWKEIKHLPHIQCEHISYVLSRNCKSIYGILGVTYAKFEMRGCLFSAYLPPSLSLIYDLIDSITFKGGGIMSDVFKIVIKYPKLNNTLYNK